MSDIWLDVDVALVVPLNKIPIVLKSDGVTISAAMAYNAAGMDLNWNFMPPAGPVTHTNIVPTTGGVHDLLALANGMYSFEIPDTGGTVNNDTEGFGWLSGETTDEVVWASPVFGFRAAALNDAAFEGGNLFDVNVTHIADLIQTAKDLGALLQIIRDGIILGTVGPTNLSNTTCSSNLTIYTVSQLVGRAITFLTGDAEGESTNISGYVVTDGVFTFDALSGAVAPANNDLFKVT